MSDDLISRQAAIKQILLCENHDMEHDFEFNEGLIAAMNAIEDLPTAEPEPSQVARDIATIIENEQDMRVILSHPKKGKWIDYCGGVKCDQCGFECDDTYYLGEANFCPNCGARMEGE